LQIQIVKTTPTKIFELLRKYESQNITYVSPNGSWPIVWERAQGMYVWDATGKKYLDLTGAFGVAAAGHANRRIVQAGKRQMTKLLHAMGDVHPHSKKAELARELSRMTFERWTAPKSKGRSQESKVQNPKSKVSRGKTIFCNSGFEAVEAALKTALLATRRPGVIAFEKAYHGLGYGALNATHRKDFRFPFRSQLAEFAHFVPFPTQVGELSRLGKAIRLLLRRSPIGAILVEPVQGRGGINIPPSQFLPLLRKLCDESGSLLILDEVMTGFGRTGRWFACEHTQTIPDLICLGKALTGGFPLSACVGRGDLMDAAWPISSGEALHTSTFLGHPVGCAMALAEMEEIRAQRLVERSALLGRKLLELLSAVRPPPSLLVIPRGLGLMAGLELCYHDHSPATAIALEVIQRMVDRGFLLLPGGEQSNVISFTPPLIVTESQLEQVVRALAEELAAVMSK
jgi:4-aminobutyrate aminotransferase-like enzyme